MSSANSVSTHPDTSAGRSARRRMAVYGARIEQAKGKDFRPRLWVLLGWLVAEANRLPTGEQAELLDDLTDRLKAMNMRSADRDR